MSNFNSRSFIVEGEDSHLGLDILKDDHDGLDLKEAIIDLYLNVKIRNSEDVSLSLFRPLPLLTHETSLFVDRQLQRRKAQRRARTTEGYRSFRSHRVHKVIYRNSP